MAPLGQVEEMHRAELAGEPARPLVEQIRERNAVCNAERQVEVRPAISPGEGERADLGTGNDPSIGRSELEHPVADAVALFDV